MLEKTNHKQKNTNKIQAWIVGRSQLVTQFWLAFINIDSNQVHAKNAGAQQRVW